MEPNLTRFLLIISLIANTVTKTDFLFVMIIVGWLGDKFTLDTSHRQMWNLVLVDKFIL